MVLNVVLLKWRSQWISLHFIILPDSRLRYYCTVFKALRQINKCVDTQQLPSMHGECRTVALLKILGKFFGFIVSGKSNNVLSNNSNRCIDFVDLQSNKRKFPFTNGRCKLSKRTILCMAIRFRCAEFSTLVYRQDHYEKFLILQNWEMPKL